MRQSQPRQSIHTTEHQRCARIHMYVESCLYQPPSNCSDKEHWYFPMQILPLPLAGICYLNENDKKTSILLIPSWWKTHISLFMCWVYVAGFGNRGAAGGSVSRGSAAPCQTRVISSCSKIDLALPELGHEQHWVHHSLVLTALVC